MGELAEGGCDARPGGRYHALRRTIGFAWHKVAAEHDDLLGRFSHETARIGNALFMRVAVVQRLAAPCSEPMSGSGDSCFIRFMRARNPGGRALTG